MTKNPALPPWTEGAQAAGVGWDGGLWGIFESQAIDFSWLQTLHLFLKCTLNYYA